MYYLFHRWKTDDIIFRMMYCERQFPRKAGKKIIIRPCKAAAGPVHSFDPAYLPIRCVQVSLMRIHNTHSVWTHWAHGWSTSSAAAIDRGAPARTTVNCTTAQRINGPASDYRGAHDVAPAERCNYILNNIIIIIIIEYDMRASKIKNIKCTPRECTHYRAVGDVRVNRVKLRHRVGGTKRI